jgi:hypothetical protein
MIDKLIEYKKIVSVIEIVMTNGKQISSSTMTLPNSMPLGEALTYAMDMRKDKTMYLVSYRP